jgi:hypothetical protein
VTAPTATVRGPVPVPAGVLAGTGTTGPAGVVMTAGPGSHVLAAECEAACLAGLLPPHLYRLTAAAAARADGPATAGTVAGLLTGGSLARTAGFGPARLAVLAGLFADAGLIAPGWHAAAPAAGRVRADGPAIRAARTRRGWTVLALGRNARVSTATITHLENGTALTCRAATIGKLAAALHQPAATLTKPGPPAAHGKATL